MSQQYPDEVRRGLKLQALGNDLVALFGARSVHPVGARIGGFSKAPDQQAVDTLLQRVTAARQDAIDLVRWVDALDLADDEQAFVSVALHHEDEYPFNEGRLVSDVGLDIAIDEFEQHFTEKQVDYSTALHCLLDGRSYRVGPLARVNLNQALLPEEVKQIMPELKASFPSKNMFHSIDARAIEIYFSLVEAERLLQAYQPTAQPSVEFNPQAGTEYGCTGTPRGFLWHRYDLDEKGCVKKAVIVPADQPEPVVDRARSEKYTGQFRA